ncbi:DNA N6-methyl adenine demethylase [Gryllus bimaculatus]|nr:DNA N6-methyl adenine demethylase [Gryllus bimaculatus]
MSEGGSQGPESLGPAYPGTGGGGGYQQPPSQPPTPSSTVQDNGGGYKEDFSGVDVNGTSKSSSSSGLPPFSSFSAADEALNSRMSGDAFGEGLTSRLLDISSWDYYGSEGLAGRIVDRPTTDGLPMLVPQPQYRPWESKGPDSVHNDTLLKSIAPAPPSAIPAFTDSFSATTAQKLPSFQSQFNAFPQEQTVTGNNGEVLTTLTAASPSPSSSSSGLPSFHTLSTVNPRPGYPLVPAPVQAREIPAIQQQFLDERHIQLFAHTQPFGAPHPHLNNQPAVATLGNAQFHHHSHQITLTPPNTAPPLLPGNTLVAQNAPTVLTVVKTEPVTLVTSDYKMAPQQLTQLHHSNFQNPMGVIDVNKMGDGLKFSDSPTRGTDSRKKERRKVRASSLESSTESDGAGSSSVESSGQVAAVSSTAGFKSPMQPSSTPSVSDSEGEKPVKKKRKRCGECTGCQRKDNCGDCAPCRNDKSHQICKMRRCEKLTEKKVPPNFAGGSDGSFARGDTRRGRGKTARGLTTGFRGKVSRTQQQQQQQQQAQQSAAAPVNDSAAMMSGTTAPSVMPFYGANSGALPPQPGNMVDPGAGFAPPLRDRFPNSVWHPAAGADPNGVGTWTPQGQFIQQLGPIQEDLRYHHHPQYSSAAPYHQTPGSVGLTNSGVNGLGNGHGGTATVNGVNGGTVHRNGTLNGQYMDTSPGSQYADQREYVNGGSSYNPSQDVTMAPPPSTTPTSRSSSVHLDQNAADGTNMLNSTKNSGNYNNNSTATNASNNSTGHPNALPGYLLPPQLQQQHQQSLQNSSRYSGQENAGEMIGSWSSADARIGWHQNEHNNTSKTEPVNMYRDDDSSANESSMYNERVNLNSRLKTMILNKQQQQQHLNQQLNQQMHQYSQLQQQQQMQRQMSMENLNHLSSSDANNSHNSHSSHNSSNSSHHLMSPTEQQMNNQHSQQRMPSVPVSQSQYMSSPNTMMSQNSENHGVVDRLMNERHSSVERMINEGQGHNVEHMIGENHNSVNQTSSNHNNVEQMMNRDHSDVDRIMGDSRSSVERMIADNQNGVDQMMENQAGMERMIADNQSLDRMIADNSDIDRMLANSQCKATILGTKRRL